MKTPACVLVALLVYSFLAFSPAAAASRGAAADADPPLDVADSGMAGTAPSRSETTQNLRRVPTVTLLRSAKDDFQSGRFSQASAKFEELLMRPLPPAQLSEVYAPLCESKLREGKLAEAESLAVAAVKHTKDEVELERIGFMKAEIVYFAGDAARAMDEYLLFLEENPESRFANDVMERLLLIDENVGTNPGPLAAYAHAELLALAGARDSALAVLDSLLASTPGALIADDALMRKADLLRSLGDYSDALSQYRLVEVKFSRSRLVPVCKLRIADLYANELREKAKAIAECEEIATLFPETSFAVEARSILATIRAGSKKRD